MYYVRHSTFTLLVTMRVIGVQIQQRIDLMQKDISAIVFQRKRFIVENLYPTQMTSTTQHHVR